MTREQLDALVWGWLQEMLGEQVTATTCGLPESHTVELRHSRTGRNVEIVGIGKNIRVKAAYKVWGQIAFINTPRTMDEAKGPVFRWLLQGLR